MAICKLSTLLVHTSYLRKIIGIPPFSLKVAPARWCIVLKDNSKYLIARGGFSPCCASLEAQLAFLSLSVLPCCQPPGQAYCITSVGWMNSFLMELMVIYLIRTKIRYYKSMASVFLPWWFLPEALRRTNSSPFLAQLQWSNNDADAPKFSHWIETLTFRISERSCLEFCFPTKMKPSSLTLPDQEYFYHGIPLAQEIPVLRLRHECPSIIVKLRVLRSSFFLLEVDSSTCTLWFPEVMKTYSVFRYWKWPTNLKNSPLKMFLMFHFSYDIKYCAQKSLKKMHGLSLLGNWLKGHSRSIKFGIWDSLMRTNQCISIILWHPETVLKLSMSSILTVQFSSKM